jgi:hypothetical protein
MNNISIEVYVIKEVQPCSRCGQQRISKLAWKNLGRAEEQ